MLLIGGEFKDILTGDFGDDVLIGLAGDDRLLGRGGRDTLMGGKGNDALFGEDGDDALWGEAGDDRMWGGSGNDELNGGSGNDYLDGGKGDDKITAGVGDDEVVGGEGMDTLQLSVLNGYGYTVDLEAGTGSHIKNVTYGPSGSIVVGPGWHFEDTIPNYTYDTLTVSEIENIEGTDYNDILLGDSGSNFIYSGDGDDVIDGRDGDDYLQSFSGTNTMIGGAGDDTLYIANGARAEMTGGEGADEFEFILIESGDGGQVGIITDFSSAEGDRITILGNDRLYFQEDDMVTPGGGHEVRLIQQEGSGRARVEIEGNGFSSGDWWIDVILANPGEILTTDDFFIF
ncbi:calcium-binding protein [Litoreibacter roseus]|uniref:Hemolysin-type calcium-binding repeat-containing protein n=1 Tax=Litoreibacter roseus TaxID=2601869 RepID=A0A6N6JBL4_9RHOB|nr:calcium-binding protein [Litoreibacter roseus]GFE63661.1 hypothetical protein KIN_07350 [Litoreibacter roseus]